jgi:hypothetical protein
MLTIAQPLQIIRSNDTSSYPSPFFTALACVHPNATASQDTLKYLVKQISADYGVSYFDRGDPKYGTVPDDIDDTCLVAESLYLAGALNPVFISNLVYHLTRLEVRPGGPYYTWLTERPENHGEPDFYVNLNIYRILSRLNVTTPHLCSWLKENVITRPSAFYTSPVLCSYIMRHTQPFLPFLLPECSASGTPTMVAATIDNEQIVDSCVEFCRYAA